MSRGYDELNAVLGDAGVSKTIYALVMPETEEILDQVLDGGGRSRLLLREILQAQEEGVAGAQLAERIAQALDAAREPLREMYREAWTQKQDSLHEAFFEAWMEWSRPIVALDSAQFPFMYPTAGASEALRAVINDYGNAARAAGVEPVIHVFDGEYEGFAAFAEAAQIALESHNRSTWQAAVEKIGPHHQFYISQPSAIDGKVWSEFDDFAQGLYRIQPGAALMLDLTYVGCVARPFRVRADYPNISAVFFSLSKPAGTYYHRIGGCLARRSYGGLFGNKWFKNLLALRIGTEFMARFGVHELPRKYQATQHDAIDRVNASLGLALAPSDVVLLAIAPPSAHPSDLEGYLTRGSAGEALVRVCLTPTMANLIDPTIDARVKARPHERLEAEAN